MGCAVMGIPEYRWVQGKPDPHYHGSTGGCFGCAFRPMTSGIKCSDIPCQRYPGMIAEFIPKIKI